MNLVINYAAIGFRPYQEIGEFINVGLVAVEARSRYLSYRLAPPRRTRRVGACFPELDLSLFRQGMQRLENELSLLALDTNQWAANAKPSGSNHPSQIDLFIPEGDRELFDQITALRTSPFFFSSQGTRLAHELESTVDDLFRKYVEHWNLTPVDYEEKKLTRDIKRLLQAHRLEKLYREAPWVGTDIYHVGIPLAHTPRDRDQPSKVIKPLNLAQATPTRIYTHGDEWIAKVRRLQQVDCLPEEFLFVVKKPEDHEARAAADEICEGLLQTGVQIVEVGDDASILAFARIEEPDLELEAE